jgi:hypothetical protein
MSFLDELKKEAEARKQKEMAETQSRLEAVNRNFLLVQGRLQEVYRYLKKLVEQLGEIDLPVHRSYYVEGIGQVDKLLQTGYAVALKRMTLGHKDFIKEILLGFKCVSDKTFTIEKDSPAAIERQRDYLWRNNIRFDYEEFRNERGYVYRGTFTVPAIIPVSFIVSGDLESARIRISTKNFNMLIATEFIYELSEVDNAFLDEFAKYLLNKPSNFIQYGKRLG